MRGPSKVLLEDEAIVGCLEYHSGLKVEVRHALIYPWSAESRLTRDVQLEFLENFEMMSPIVFKIGEELKIPDFMNELAWA